MSVTARPSPDLSAGPAPASTPLAATPGLGRRGVSPEIGRSLLAAAAVLAGASSLTSPVSGSSWVLPLIEVVAVIWLVGVGGRLIQLPAAVTVLLQVAGYLIAETSLFTTSGVGGVLPGRAALAEGRILFADALAQVAGTSSPTPSTPALSLLISLAVGGAALAADILVTLAKSPALLAMPLLCLYFVPVSIMNTMLPWYAFAAPAVLYAALLAMPDHHRHTARPPTLQGGLLSGGVITALALAAALTVAGSTTIIGTGGLLPRTSGSGVALSPFASLQGSLKNPAAVPVLTATGLSTPDYFRTVTLSTWTANRGWSLGQIRADVSSSGGSLTPAAIPGAGSTVTVTAQNLRDRFLPILTGTFAIDGLTDTWSYDTDLSTVFRPTPVNPGRYLLTVEEAKPVRSALQADAAVGGGALTDTGPLSPMVQATARKVTAAQSGPFDKAAALQRWFTDPANGFTYSLDVPAQDTDDALVDFLTHKQGFCQQYASAMAIMLRSLNIPARVVIGYTQGVHRADGSYLVTSRNAHAWVEVKFRDNGWVRFDPTPAVNGQGGQQGFTDNTASLATTPPVAPTVPAAAPKPPKTEQQPPGAASTAAAAATPGGSIDVRGPGPGWAPIALLTLLAAAALGGALTAPTMLRRRRRRSRLRVAAAGGEQAAAAAWDELQDTAIDHQLFPQPTETARAIANRVARRAQLTESDRAGLRRLVLEVETGWYSRPPAGVSDARSDDRSSPGSRTATRTLEDTIHDDPGSGDFAAVVQAIVGGLRIHAPQRRAKLLFPQSLHGSAR